jgi:hypothetical protein
MTNKLDESIIFLNNLLIDKDLTFEFLEGVTVPLGETCIAIANSLKKYGRPDDEQLKGLFCLCYYQKLIQPEEIDVSKINDFLGEDLVDDLEIFRFFALDLQGVYSLSQSRLIEDEDKIPFFWLFYALDELLFKNQISHDFLGFILKIEGAPQSLKESMKYEQFHLTRPSPEQEKEYGRAVVEEITKFEAMMGVSSNQ